MCAWTGELGRQIKPEGATQKLLVPLQLERKKPRKICLQSLTGKQGYKAERVHMASLIAGANTTHFTVR